MQATEWARGLVMNVLRRQFSGAELLGIKDTKRVQKIIVDAGGHDPNVIADQLANQVEFSKQIQVIDDNTGRASKVLQPEQVGMMSNQDLEELAMKEKARKILEGADPRKILLESGLVDGVPEVMAENINHPNYVWEYQGEQYESEYQGVAEARAELSDNLNASVVLNFTGEADVQLELGFQGFPSNFGDVTIGSGRDEESFEVELFGHIEFEAGDERLDTDLDHSQLDVDSFTELFTFAPGLGDAVEGEATGMVDSRDKKAMQANLEIYGLR